MITAEIALSNLGNDCWLAWQAITSGDFSLQPTHPWLRHLDAEEDRLQRGSIKVQSPSTSAVQCPPSSPPPLATAVPDSPQAGTNAMPSQPGTGTHRRTSHSPKSPPRFTKEQKGKGKEKEQEQDDHAEVADQQEERGRSRQRQPSNGGPKSTRSRARSKSRPNPVVTDEPMYSMPCDGCKRRNEACTFRKDGAACGPCHKRKVKCNHVGKTEGRSWSKTRPISPSPAPTTTCHWHRPRSPSREPTTESTPTTDASTRHPQHAHSNAHSGDAPSTPPAKWQRVLSIQAVRPATTSLPLQLKENIKRVSISHFITLISVLTRYGVSGAHCLHKVHTPGVMGRSPEGTRAATSQANPLNAICHPYIRPLNVNQGPHFEARVRPTPSCDAGNERTTHTCEAVPERS